MTAASLYGTSAFRGARTMGRAVSHPFAGLGVDQPEEDVGASVVIHVAGAALAGGIVGYISGGYSGHAATIGALLMVGVTGLGETYTNMKAGRSNAALASAFVGVGGVAFSLYLAKRSRGEVRPVRG